MRNNKKINRSIYLEKETYEKVLKFVEKKRYANFNHFIKVIIEKELENGK